MPEPKTSYKHTTRTSARLFTYMDLLRVWTKREPSPPLSPPLSPLTTREEGISPGTTTDCPRDRLDLTKEIYVEEDRHQRAMMAMENSLMDCGSDDWSVDSDYAFQSFSDDDSAVAQTSRDARNSRSPPFRHHERHWRPRVCDTIAGDDEIPDSHGGAAENSPKFNRSPDEVSHLDVRREASTKSANEGVGMAGRVVVSDNSCSEVERDGEGLASSRDDHSKHQSGAYEARHFGDPGSSTENVQILRLEQRMFLKAAFQLLEERDRQSAATNLNNSWGGLGPGLLGTDHVRGGGGIRGRGRGTGGSGAGLSEGGAVGEEIRFQQGELRTRSVIKGGSLRKATSRSVGRLETTTWKTKRVELSPGRFAYADGGSVLGKKSTKAIPLYLGFCTCRTLKVKETTPSARGSMIKSSSLNLSGRAGSRDGRARGDSGPGSGGGGGLGGEGGGGGDHSKHLLEIMVVGAKRRVWAAESKQECRRWVNAIKGAMTERPVDPTETTMGENQMPTIPPDSCYRRHMESYLTARASLRLATSIDAYMEALEGLRAASNASDSDRRGSNTRDSRGCPFGVPVKWVKQQLPGAERAYQEPARYRGKSALAQLWKDMKRDTVSINGRVLKGERGPEAIVGALTRCILAQAGRLPASDSLSKLSEARSLLAARDVLLACDRTTSGGDTYLVVDNLCRNPDLVVLVPASQEAEPLEIQVTLHPRPSPHTPFPLREDPFGSGSGAARSASAVPAAAIALTPPSPASGGEPSPLASPNSGYDSLSPSKAEGRVGGAVAGHRCRTTPALAGGDGSGGSPAVLLDASGALSAEDAQVLAEPQRRGVRLTLPGKRRPGRMERTANAPGRTQPVKISSHRRLLSYGGGSSKHSDYQFLLSLAATAPPSAGFSRAVSDPVEDRQTLGSESRSQGVIADNGRTKVTVRGGGGGGGGGGSIFASLTRRRSEDITCRGSSDTGHANDVGGKSTLRNPLTLSMTPASAREGFRDRGGGGGRNGFGDGTAAEGGGFWRDVSSAPTKSSSVLFFGEDTSDGGQGSDSSCEGDGDGPPSRKSYIRVACTARTSYKLFSSDPQDEDRDMYAVVTGLFEQTFTISREMAGRDGGGHVASSTAGSATRTQGSVAFLTFHEPSVQRGSIDRSETCRATEATSATAAAFGIEAHSSICEPCASPHSNPDDINPSIENVSEKRPDTSLKLSDCLGSDSGGEEGDLCPTEGYGSSQTGGAHVVESTQMVESTPVIEVTNIADAPWKREGATSPAFAWRRDGTPGGSSLLEAKLRSSGETVANERRARTDSSRQTNSYDNSSRNNNSVSGRNVREGGTPHTTPHDEASFSHAGLVSPSPPSRKTPPILSYSTALTLSPELDDGSTSNGTIGARN